MVKSQGVCLLLFLVLVATDIVSAGSKHGFAPIEERELSYYLQKQEQVNDPYLYLFSTLFLINRHKESAAFTISKSSSKYAAPLAMMEIYPELDMGIQSEFFDFTIWGQLGNYFNKSIEIIELEGEILRILKEFKELNERYKDLIQTTNSVVPQPQRLPTLDKKNYISVDEKSGREKSSKNPEDPRYSARNRSMNDLRSEIQRYETQLQQERLRLTPTFQQPKPDVFGQRAYEAAYLRVAEPPRKLDASSSEADGVFISIIEGLMAFIMAFMRYLINNKVESCIYLFFLFLLSMFVKVLLQQ